MKGESMSKPDYYGCRHDYEQEQAALEACGLCEKTSWDRMFLCEDCNEHFHENCIDAHACCGYFIGDRWVRKD